MTRWLSLLFLRLNKWFRLALLFVVLLLSENVTSAVARFFFSLLVWYEKKALFIEKKCNLQLVFLTVFS